MIRSPWHDLLRMIGESFITFIVTIVVFFGGFLVLSLFPNTAQGHFLSDLGLVLDGIVLFVALALYLCIFRANLLSTLGAASLAELLIYNHFYFGHLNETFLLLNLTVVFPIILSGITVAIYRGMVERTPDARGGMTLPIVSMAYGIIIRMCLIDDRHHMPHIHARKAELEASIGTEDGEFLAGDLPRWARSL